MSTEQGTGSQESQGQSQELGNAMDQWGPGEGGQGGATTQTSTTQQTQQTQQSSTGETTQQKQAQTPSPATTLTPDLIAAAISATAEATAKRIGTQSQVTQATKEMTDDEFNARYGITKYDAKYIERLFDKDPNAAAQVLNEISRNSYTAALRMSNDLFQAELSKLRKEFEPKVSAFEKHVSEVREVQARDRFYKTHPDLLPEAEVVQEILNAVQDRVNKGELNFGNDETKAFQFIADATKKRIEYMRSKYGTVQQNGSTGGTPPAGGQQPQNGTRQMQSVSSTARPGGQPAKKTELDAAMDAWDQTP